MTSIERTAYPVLPTKPDAVELRTRFTPKRDELLHAREYLAHERLWLNYLVLLKTFQQLGYFVQLNEVPGFIVEHIRSCLVESTFITEPAAIAIQKTARKTYYAHRENILAWLNVRLYQKRVVEGPLRTALVRATDTQHSTQVSVYVAALQVKSDSVLCGGEHTDTQEHEQGYGDARCRCIHPRASGRWCESFLFTLRH